MPHSLYSSSESPSAGANCACSHRPAATTSLLGTSNCGTLKSLRRSTQIQNPDVASSLRASFSVLTVSYSALLVLASRMFRREESRRFNLRFCKPLL